MKKSIGKHLIQIFFFLLPLWVLMLYASLFPMNYMEIEYPAWVQQLDFAKKGTAYDILIIGDSRSKAGLIPDELSPHTYNMSVGGATSIEMFYTLTKYLENHQAPSYAFLIFAPKHVTEIDNWNQTLLYNYLDFKELAQVYYHAARFHDPTVCSGFYVKDYFFYKTRFPTRYLLFMHNAGFIGNRRANMEKYKELNESRGHMLYGTDPGNDLFNYEVSYKSFQKSPLVDYYYHKLLDLCMEHQIEVIVEQAPMNAGSYDFLTPSYYDGYVHYMKSIQEEYPSITLNPYVPRYDNEFFGDTNHLNLKGATKFSHELRNKYPSIFLSPEQSGQAHVNSPSPHS